jgi:hypothetical protein
MRAVAIGSTFVGLALALAAAAQAQALYKCRAADGSLSYQDRPCDDGAESLAPPPIAPPPRDPYVPDLPDAVPPPLAQDTPVERPRPPLPRFYHCEKPEGGSYVSETPNLQPRQVPLWTLDRYAPTFGRGLGATGALYTQVADRCRVLGRGEACAELRRKLGRAEHDANLAFRDTRDALDAQVAGLRDTLAANCR